MQRFGMPRLTPPSSRREQRREREDHTQDARAPEAERRGNAVNVHRVQLANALDEQAEHGARRTVDPRRPADADDRARAATPLTAEERAEVPAITNNTTLNAATLRTGYANNPRAQSALDSLTADPAYRALPAGQQGGVLARFQEAPNSATAQYARGLSAYHGATDQRTGLEAFRQARDPDGGTMNIAGATYGVNNGQLTGANGAAAGNVRTDGTFQLGTGERQNYYDQHNTRVQLTEGRGANQQELLNLHPADPRGVLSNANVNSQFRERATGTLTDMRREGVSMMATDGFRDYQRQDELYAQGRTAPGARVTNARGGQSWHNYGVAADSTFTNAQGQPEWPTTGEHARLWERYGEKGQARGLEWGGSWRNQDLPHHEYHPNGGSARANETTLRNQGLPRVWQEMGIP